MGRAPPTPLHTWTPMPLPEDAFDDDLNDDDFDPIDEPVVGFDEQDWDEETATGKLDEEEDDATDNIDDDADDEEWFDDDEDEDINLWI